MKTLNKFRHILLFMLLAFAGTAMGQSFTGSFIVVKGTATTYNWNQPAYSYTQYMGGTIRVSGGIITENNSTSLYAPYGKTFTVQWDNTVGVGRLWVEYTMRYYSPGSSSYTQSGLLIYEKQVSRVEVGAATSLTGDQSVTAGETAAYNWKYIPVTSVDAFVSGTISVSGGVIVENNASTIASGDLKNFSVRWTGVSGTISVNYSYKRSGATISESKTLNVAIAGASGCYTALNTTSLFQLSGNACTVLNAVESYYFRSYPAGQVQFTGATIAVTGGVVVENNSTSIFVGPEKTFSVRWTTPGAGKLHVTYNFNVYPSGPGAPTGPLPRTNYMTFPVTVGYASARVADFEESTLAVDNPIYPNPATAGSEIFLNMLNTAIEKVIVRNLEGRIQNADVTVGEKISISTHGLSKGMYVVQVITDEGKSTTHKFSVE